MLVTSSSKLRALAQTGASTNNNATSSTSILINTLHHGVAVFTSATSVTLYYDGAVTAGGAISIAFSGVNLLSVGALYLNTATAIDLWKGTIAYPAVRNIALTGTNVTDLYNAGAGKDSSLYLPSSVVSFSKFQSGPPYLDTGASTTWTLTGSPTIVADPFALGFLLAGTCTGHANSSGFVGVLKQLAATCTVKAANSGNVICRKPLQASDSAQAANAANLICSKPLIGQNNPVDAANAATLTAPKLLAASCIGKGNNAGTVRAPKILAVNCLIKASNVGNLIARKNLKATCTVHGSNTAGLATAVDLSGTCTWHTATTAFLGTPKAMAAVCTARASNTATLRATKPLRGPETTHSACSASLSVIGNPKNLACNGLGAAASSGSLSMGNAIVGREARAKARNDGSLEVDQILQTFAFARGSSTGVLLMGNAIMASCTAQSSQSAYLSLTSLYATCRMTVGNSADLTNILFLFGRNFIELQLFTQQFISVWVVANPGVLVKYSNRNFVEPANSAWVEFGADSGSVNDVSLSGSMQRGFGEVWLDMYFPENSGTMTMRAMADSFADCLSRQNFQYNNGNIWTRQPSIGKAFAKTGWSRWRTTIPFKHDQFDLPVSDVI